MSEQQRKIEPLETRMAKLTSTKPKLTVQQHKGAKPWEEAKDLVALPLLLLDSWRQGRDKRKEGALQAQVKGEENESKGRKHGG